jgi:2,3-dihydroxybiphenyl 1,2-dioxygenase
MDILGIGYLGFESPNSKAWLEYGPEVLGFGLDESHDDDSVYLRMDDRRYRIAMSPGERDRLAYIGWELKSRTSWLDAIAKLEAAGVDVTIGDTDLERERGAHAVARFTDMVGYNHELIYGQQFMTNSFVPGRPHHGFVAEALGLGHVVLIAPEVPEEYNMFMQDVMGFRWMGHGAIRVPGGFWRAKLNPRSHCIAVLQGPPKHFGIHHVGIETKEIDDVGIAWDMVQERNIPIQMTLGRHTQDPVISFYSFTPSGFIVEYLTQGALWSEEEFFEVNPQRLSVWGHKQVGPPLPETVAPIE